MDKPTRNPPSPRDGLILALALYAPNPAKQSGKSTEAVATYPRY
jgi:hypothetical protein